MKYPRLIQSLINNFASLPGIGTKTAERLVFHLLKQNDNQDLTEFGNNLLNIKKQIKTCPVCGNYTTDSQCEICTNAKRDKTIICVVADVQDIFYLDKTHTFNGQYHVLNGLLVPANGITPDKLNIENLLKRLKNNVQEIILGFNPTVEGESTIIYLKKLLKEKFPNLKITRLSRGLPMGGDLEYADEVTLSNAINNRSEV